VSSSARPVVHLQQMDVVGVHGSEAIVAEIVQLGDVHVCTFVDLSQAVTTRVGGTLRRRGIEPHLGERGLEFTINRSDPLAALQEAGEIMASLKPERVVYWYYRLTATGREEVHLEHSGLQARRQLQLAVSYLPRQTDEDGEPARRIVEALNATGLCSQIVPGRQDTLAITLTRGAAANYMASYATLVAALPSAEQLT
jgi:hypothetical protein